jgi:Ran GTPase-activating protein (RanGAP) involved in mRNA processing and transport
MHILHFIQTLTQLNLSFNKIRDQGVQYLGEALQKNSVTENIHLLHFYHMHILHFIQTLTQLDLSVNRIGAQGGQYLCEALKKNSVRQNSHCLHFYHMHIFAFYTDTHTNQPQNQ